MADKEMQDEMVGVLTAISIVSKRLAGRLLQLNTREENDEDAQSPDNRQKKKHDR